MGQLGGHIVGNEAWPKLSRQGGSGSRTPFNTPALGCKEANRRAAHDRCTINQDMLHLFNRALQSPRLRASLDGAKLFTEIRFLQCEQIHRMSHECIHENARREVGTNSKCAREEGDRPPRISQDYARLL